MPLKYMAASYMAVTTIGVSNQVSNHDSYGYRQTTLIILTHKEF